MELNKRNMRRLMLLIAFAILFYTLMQNPEIISAALGGVYAVVSPIILGICIAFVLNILLVLWDERILKGMAKSRNRYVRSLQRPLSMILTLITTFGAITLILCVIIPQITETMSMIGTVLPEFCKTVWKWLLDLMTEWNLSVDQISSIEINWNEIWQMVISWLKIGSMSAVNIATSVSTSLFGWLFNLILGIIIAIYILLQKEKLLNAIDMLMKSYMKEKSYNRAIHILKLSKQSFANFIAGQLLEAVILGTLCFIGMLIFRFPYASVVSVLVGVTALIPMFGAWIGGGISALLILMVDPMKALLFIIFILILQQIEGNLIYPRVVGQSVGLPGLLVLVAVIIGGNLFSVAGILISVPLCSIIYTVVRESVNERLKKRQEEAPKSKTVKQGNK